MSVTYILLAFLGATLSSIGAPIETTLDTFFSAFFEILLRIHALRHLPFPIGLGTHTVFLLGKYPSQFSIIDLTSGLSHAIIKSSGDDISLITGANSLACAG